MTKINASHHVSMFDSCFAAICIWEALDGSERGAYPGLDHLRDHVADFSVTTMREQVIELAPIAEMVWQQARDCFEFDQCFDYEFIPLFLVHVTSAGKKNATKLRFLLPETHEGYKTAASAITAVSEAADLIAMSRNKIAAATVRPE